MLIDIGVIHLARTHERERGRAKAYAMRTGGRGLTHLSTYAKSPVCMYFVILPYGTVIILCCL